MAPAQLLRRMMLQMALISALRDWGEVKSLFYQCSLGQILEDIAIKK
jgi:hypothetical protein